MCAQIAGHAVALVLTRRTDYFAQQAEFVVFEKFGRVFLLLKGDKEYAQRLFQNAVSVLVDLYFELVFVIGIVVDRVCQMFFEAKTAATA